MLHFIRAVPVHYSSVYGDSEEGQEGGGVVQRGGGELDQLPPHQVGL